MNTPSSTQPATMVKAIIPTLYDTDFNLWIEETVRQLKQGDLQSLDLDNLIEEIESMGRSDKREVKNRLIVLMIHLLEWRYQPEKRSNSWTATINEQRRQLGLITGDSPSLKPFLVDNFPGCYQIARRDAVRETFLSLSVFPLDCPFSLAEILNAEFFPD
ncbi:sll0803 [Synechocystis sp. PCC 6803]|uniref:Sll0803 protein n=2 Tax=unclassified Synechocystis TaxID=2640012 RepID=P74065_SYNY3|nr:MULTISPECIES: DUF29 domain-containing protein [unclassified Synechocystis]BAL29313.1 hypothetical protein SYNGTI_1566 [Synechocystis sp. PCC 6803 substr. GT-I]BAL32482.1 hypothetical protein SYNPCCN_1565 [Synechocystis sp. PCC 6803 substr. PCC-N]BAL35651.1 hypothetical protein SYNPCCP_1565 [Synechocystis sp. PCC 6803 substr. PCC-P]AGF51829.1 hypothetical protein MYO_115800 [Synechocystis sp. PCC 6803]ALJ67804.1 hypothetical protein AOY38_08115 [Synechocystis sp. PCC 6803]